MDWRLGDIQIRADAQGSAHGIGLWLRASREGRPTKGVQVLVCGPNAYAGATDGQGCFVMPPRRCGHDEDALMVRVSKGPLEEFAVIKVLPVAAHEAGRGWRSEGVHGKSGWQRYREPQRTTSPADRPPRSREVDPFRRLVVEFQGNTQMIAERLGVSRPTVSRKLNGPVHQRWWCTFKEQRSRHNRREQQRRTRCRRWVRDLLTHVGQEQSFQRELRARLSTIANLRGATREELLAGLRARWPDDPAIAPLHDVLEGLWNRVDADRIADGVYTMAVLLELPRGPGTLYRPRRMATQV